MKTRLLCVVLLCLSTAAQAKLAPVETPRLTPAPDEFGMVVGPAGAMLESDYFNAPQTGAATSQIFPCRLKLHVFDKMQIAQSCH